MTRGDVAQKLWMDLLETYNQTGTTWVRLPVPEIMTILTSLQANLLAQVEDPDERRALMQSIGPVLDNMVSKVRARSYNRMAWRGPNSLVLPN